MGECEKKKPPSGHNEKKAEKHEFSHKAVLVIMLGIGQVNDNIAFLPEATPDRWSSF